MVTPATHEASHSRALWAWFGASGLCTVVVILLGMWWAESGHRTISRAALAVGAVPVTLFWLAHLEVMRRMFWKPPSPDASWWSRLAAWCRRLFWIISALAIGTMLVVLWWHFILAR